MTNREKNIIRAHYSYMKLRFNADGSVDGQKHKGGPYGRLYSSADAQRHIDSVRNVVIPPTH